MPDPKKRKPAKKAAKKKAKPRGPTNAAQLKAQTEALIEATTDGPVTAVTVPASTVSALFTARDWQGLLGENAPEKIEQLFHHAMSEEGKSDSWADVLMKAGVPFLAWSIMRDELDEAKHLYVAWSRRKADTLAHEILSLGDEAGSFALAETVGALKLRIDARRWLASRFDPQLYGVKVQTLATIEKRESIRIEIVDESGPR